MHIVMHSILLPMMLAKLSDSSRFRLLDGFNFDVNIWLIVKQPGDVAMTEHPEQAGTDEELA